MSRINVLDTVTANAIKAGEVIERPVSVIKELFDNAIDAGATSVRIEFENGGISLIRVSDNGVGMDREDAQLAFLVHATSKIKTKDDIYNISTMGFRGEALASIAACSEVTLITKQADTDIGTRVEYKDGALTDVEDAAADNGTTITVRNLFENVPARYKFLKKDATEGMYIVQMLERMCVVNPHVAVKLIKDGNLIMQTPGNGDMYDTIYSIFGKETAQNLIPVNYDYEGMRLRGFTGKADYVKGTRAMQNIYVNDRTIKSAGLSKAISEAYRNLVMKNKYPICFLCIYIEPELVDVNVHPQKTEVRFTNESDVFRLILHGIKNVVLTGNSSPEQMSFKPAGNSLPFIVEDPIPAAPASAAPAVSAPASYSQTVYNPQPVYSKPSYSNTKPAEPEATRDQVEAYGKMLGILSGMEIDKKPVSEPDDVFTDFTALVKEDEKPSAMPKTENENGVNLEDYNELASADFVGFLFKTYIVLQSEKHVFYIDQHAAHERVLYEQFLKQHLENNGELLTQSLLIPKVLSVGASDYSFLCDNLDSFAEHGFDIELLGNREFAVRSVPFGADDCDMDKLFAELLENLRKELPTGSDAWYLSIATAACKAAIKGNQKITATEAATLIARMGKLRDPYHCPHGRPTFIKMSKYDIEKSFHRIV